LTVLFFSDEMRRSEDDEGFTSVEDYTELAASFELYLSSSKAYTVVDKLSNSTGEGHGIRDLMSTGRYQTSLNIHEAHHVDASHGVFNHIMGSQTNQITNNAYINTGEYLPC
jgi:hypothetical protein